MKGPNERTVKRVFKRWLKMSHPDVYETMEKEYTLYGIGSTFKEADYYFGKWFEKDATGKIAVECKGSSRRTEALGQALLYKHVKKQVDHAAIVCAEEAAEPYLVDVCRENKILLYGVDVEKKTVSRKA